MHSRYGLMHMPNFFHDYHFRRKSAIYKYAAKESSLVNQTFTIADEDYTFEKKLGRGSFGQVYAAKKDSDGKKYAIKVISLALQNPMQAMGMKDSIINEITMAKRLSKANDHIVRMFGFDFDENSGLGFIVMELGKEDLDKALERSGRLSPRDRKFVWRQLASIAMILHNHSIVHLDLKPQNLVIFNNNRIKLIDLGIAQKADTRRAGRNGTPYYSAPEVVEPWSSSVMQNTSKADSWSWGAILYRITYLRPPSYQEPSYAPPPGTPPSRDSDLRDVLEHTLVKSPYTRAGIPWLAQHRYTLR